MNDIWYFVTFLEKVGTIWTDLSLHLFESQFWIQLALIGGVFIFAKWVVAPLFLKAMKLIPVAGMKIPLISRVRGAVKHLVTPIAWLLLQWIAIEVANNYQLANYWLVIISSLLSAWIIIQLVSKLIRNDSVRYWVAILAWSIAALNIVGWLTPVMNILDSWYISIGNTRVSPLTVIKISIALWLALWLANDLSNLLEKRLKGSKTVTPSMRVLIGKMSRILLITGAVLAAISYVGVDLTALAVFSGALGVGLGFGLQKIFSNLVSGFILLMDRSIKPGDVISVNDTYGWINHLGARYVSVITRDGREHLIPNEDLIVQSVENWSFSDSLVRLRVPIGISYDSDPHKAIDLIIKATEMVPRVQLDPSPRCLLLGFGDNSVNLELRFWIDDPANGRGSVISDVLLKIWDSFKENGINIPFPQRDLNLKSVMGLTEIEHIKEALSK